MIVAPVLVLKRGRHEIFDGQVIETGKIHPIEGACVIHLAAAEWLDAAMSAEEMCDDLVAEAVFGQLLTSRHDSQIVAADDRLPEAALGASRTIAFACALIEVDIGFETDGTAVTAAVISLAHRPLPDDQVREITIKLNNQMVYYMAMMARQVYRLILFGHSFSTEIASCAARLRGL